MEPARCRYSDLGMCGMGCQNCAVRSPVWEVPDRFGGGDAGQDADRPKLGLFSRVQDGNGMTVLPPSGDAIAGPLSDSKAHAFGGG